MVLVAVSHLNCFLCTELCGLPNLGACRDLSAADFGAFAIAPQHLPLLLRRFRIACLTELMRVQDFRASRVDAFSHAALSAPRTHAKGSDYVVFYVA